MSIPTSWQQLRSESMDKENRADLIIAVRQVLAAVALAAVVAIMAHGCVGGVVRQAEIDERNATPQAYRKASPTHEQLWALDHLRGVSRVAHAERHGGGM